MKIIILLIVNAYLIAVLPSSIGAMHVDADQQAAWAQFYEDTKDLNKQTGRAK